MKDAVQFPTGKQFEDAVQEVCHLFQRKGFHAIMFDEKDLIKNRDKNRRIKKSLTVEIEIDP